MWVDEDLGHGRESGGGYARENKEETSNLGPIKGNIARPLYQPG